MSPTTWTERSLAVVSCPTKPTISTLEIEYDARVLTEADLANVVTWADSSGKANTATAVNSPNHESQGWGGTKPAIRLLTADSDAFTYDGTVFVGKAITIFGVLKALVISADLVILGNSTGTSPGSNDLTLAIKEDGAVLFSLDSASVDLASATGVITAGQDVLVTATHSSVEGKVIRINGVEVARSTSSKTNLAANATANIGRSSNLPGIGTSFGDKKLAWVSAYSTLASLAEIEQMEGFLAGLWDISGITQDGAAKPDIAGAEIEFNANSITVADGATVSTWTDESIDDNGADNDNDATAVNSPSFEKGAWIGGTQCVRFTDSPDNDHFTYDGSAFIGTNLTIFIVARVLDLTTSANFLGGSSATDLEMLEIAIKEDGSALFSFATDEGSDDAIRSIGGLVPADGECFVMTCRHSSTGGKILRVNGVQVAASATSTDNLTAYTAPAIGKIVSGFSTDMKLKWISGYTSALTDAQILAIEAFLFCEFCKEQAFIPVSIWTERSDP
ncbi:MAG: hypothetical protein V3T23_03150 [Nitrososphaerales archaeon]